MLYILQGRVRHEYGPNLEHSVENEAGDFIDIEPGVPHEVFNVSRFGAGGGDGGALGRVGVGEHCRLDRQTALTDLGGGEGRGRGRGRDGSAADAATSHRLACWSLCAKAGPFQASPPTPPPPKSVPPFSCPAAPASRSRGSGAPRRLPSASIMIECAVPWRPPHVDCVAHRFSASSDFGGRAVLLRWRCGQAATGGGCVRAFTACWMFMRKSMMFGHDLQHGVDDGAAARAADRSRPACRPWR